MSLKVVKTPLTDVDQRRIDKLLAEPSPTTGRTPLEVMISNMCWLDENAEKLLRRYERLTKAGDRTAAANTFKHYLAMREKAMDAAARCAPYVHGHLRPAERSPMPAPTMAGPREVPFDGNGRSRYDLGDNLVEATRAYLRLMRGD